MIAIEIFCYLVMGFMYVALAAWIIWGTVVFVALLRKERWAQDYVNDMTRF